MAGHAGHEFRLETLDRHHDRAASSCGVPSLDTYLKTQASQDMRRKANVVFVLTSLQEPFRIVGYFTLCAYTVAQTVVPEAARRYIPRYPLVSATLIGRLAVDASRQGRGIGAILLARALRTAYENTSVIGSSMIVVDALDDRAARFYAAHGFTRLADAMRLILPMQTVAGLVAGEPSRSK
jgi:GNAT superfamily N-acetyltransferase